MMKASAGGGGKGMRIAWNEQEAREGFHLCKGEVASSFGDDRMLVEKFVADPRHIEIQVLADQHGNCIYLNERECSIQRRNQKVIEEAPSSFLDPATSKAMGEQAVALAKAVGYTSAGGDCLISSREGVHLCKEKVASSFGDDRMPVEEFVADHRHIEIQVLADQHGNCIYLKVRVLLQRRNQKVIEEAPSSFLDPATRKAMGEQAVSLARALQEDVPIRGWAMESRVYAEDPYKKFGTPSVGRLRKYEEPSHLDRSFGQEDVPIRGWAMESRVYAEDPYKKFGTPSVGRLRKYVEPSHLDRRIPWERIDTLKALGRREFFVTSDLDSSPGVRCDSGVTEGSEISIYYDPMICKLVTYGDNRQEAIDRQVQALDQYVIRGWVGNACLDGEYQVGWGTIGCLKLRIRNCDEFSLMSWRTIMTEPRFVAGETTTSYLNEVFPDGFRGCSMTTEDSQQLIALSACIQCMAERRAQQRVSGHKFLKQSPTEFDFVVTWRGESTNVKLRVIGDELGAYT
ncbi:unnamed protein product, partial [Cyprideis torosa]